MSTATPALARWDRRPEPLEAVAVAASGRARAALAATARARLEGGAILRAAASDGWLLVLGPARDLPWADGAVYLGQEAGALLPTTVRTWPPPDLVLRAISSRTRRPDLLVALLPDAVLLVPRPERPADPALLASLVGGG